MDNLGNSNLHPNNREEPRPLDIDLDKPIPLGDEPKDGSPGVSRAPLNLGGGAKSPAPAPMRKAPAPRPAPRPAPSRPAASAAGTNERITGCRTFFTKLHAGAIGFLNEQITQWLKDNPSVVIKRTDVVTGEIQGKKTEPNILMTVWYHGEAAKHAAQMG